VVIAIVPEVLMKHWKPTEDNLRLALAELNRIGGTAADHQGFCLLIEEYLDHNELGLAFEGLLEVGNQSGVGTADFWRPMALAAGLMLNYGSYHRT